MMKSPSDREAALGALMAAEAKTMRQPNYGGEVAPRKQWRDKTGKKRDSQRTQRREAIRAALSDEWATAQDLAIITGLSQWQVSGCLASLDCERQIIRPGTRPAYAYKRAQG